MNMEKLAGVLVLLPMVLLAAVAFILGELMPGMFHGMLHALEEVNGGPLTDASYAAWQHVSQLSTFLRLGAVALIASLVLNVVLIWRRGDPVPLHKFTG